MGAAPEPFALKSQYVPAIEAAREAAGDPAKDESGEDDDKGSKSKRPATNKRKSAAGNGEPWKYNEARRAFIKEKRWDLKITYDDAVKMWDSSDAKRDYLKGVSVQELKRRKFIDKGCNSNPWAEK